MTKKTPPKAIARPTAERTTKSAFKGPPSTKADHAAFRRADKTVIKRMRKKH